MAGQPGPHRRRPRPVALVTGAAQGLGHATALRLAATRKAATVDEAILLNATTEALL